MFVIRFSTFTCVISNNIFSKTPSASRWNMDYKIYNYGRASFPNKITSDSRKVYFNCQK